MLQIAKAINAFMELRDSYTARHQWRVTQLACALGVEWGLPESCIEGLRGAALMHDIGKMAVPIEILNKAGKLNQQEFNIIKTHPQVGYNTLKRMDLPWPVAEIVLQHHERLDGSGYPHGLVGQNILLEAKILVVANVVEAMITHAPYRASHTLDAAMEEINTNKGVFYDPEVVEICTEQFTEKGFEFDLA